MEPWMWVAVGMVVIAGAFVAVSWRLQSKSPRSQDNDADALSPAKRSEDVSPATTDGRTPKRQAAEKKSDEPFVLRTDHRGQPVPPSRRREEARAMYGQDVHSAAAYGQGRAAVDGAAQVDRLVADVKSHADRRVGELDVLIAQARRHVEELQRQSAELTKTLQSAKNEAARRQAVAIERAAAARALADCETLAANPADHPPQASARPDLNWPIPERPPTDTPTERSATPDGAFVGSRHREVLLLLDQNRPPVEISRTLGLEIGEIELIANLNGRRMIHGQT